jgi:hypothetical protein
MIKAQRKEKPAMLETPERMSTKVKELAWGMKKYQEPMVPPR